MCNICVVFVAMVGRELPPMVSRFEMNTRSRSTPQRCPTWDACGIMHEATVSSGDTPPLGAHPIRWPSFVKRFDTNARGCPFGGYAPGVGGDKRRLIHESELTLLHTLTRAGARTYARARMDTNACAKRKARPPECGAGRAVWGKQVG